MFKVFFVWVESAYLSFLFKRNRWSEAFLAIGGSAQKGNS